MKEKDLRGYAGRGIAVPAHYDSTIATDFLAAARAIENGSELHGCP
jgi:hypothetical protein